MDAAYPRSRHARRTIAATTPSEPSRGPPAAAAAEAVAPPSFSSSSSAVAGASFPVANSAPSSPDVDGILRSARHSDSGRVERGGAPRQRDSSPIDRRRGCPRRRRQIRRVPPTARTETFASRPGKVPPLTPAATTEGARCSSKKRDADGGRARRPPSSWRVWTAGGFRGGGVERGLGVVVVERGARGEVGHVRGGRGVFGGEARAVDGVTPSLWPLPRLPRRW